MVKKHDYVHQFSIILEGKVEKRYLNEKFSQQISVNDSIGVDNLKAQTLDIHSSLRFLCPKSDKEYRAVNIPFTRVTTISIYFSDIEAMFERIIEKENQKYLTAISKIKWFALLDNKKAQQFVNNLISLKFKKGDVVYDIDESADCFFIIQEGIISLDSMFEVEQVRKWPSSTKSTEWEVCTQKVIKNIQTNQAPAIVGHIDILHQRPRTIRGVAMSDIVILKGHGNLLYKFLDKVQIKQMTDSVSNLNPYDIGKKFIHNDYNDNLHKRSFQDGIKVNPAPKGHRVKIPFDNGKIGSSVSASQFSRMPREDKLQVWANKVGSKNSQNIKEGKVVKHNYKRVTTPFHYLIKKELLRDPYVIENPRKIK